MPRNVTASSTPRSPVRHAAAPRLSICITTFNRGDFIGATLDSILGQLTEQCEVVIVDGASSDSTQRVVSDYARRFELLRYVRQETNSGIDRDYDRAVGLARGEYCWLMTDDDLLKPGAIAAVLQTLERNVSAVVVNVEFRDFSMARVLQRRWLSFAADRVYRGDEMDRLFAELDDVSVYVGSFIIKRSIWQERERQRYFGSWFVYLGVVFQEHLPGNAVVIAEPLISYRMDNSPTFSPHMAEIVFDTWPSLIATLAVSETVRRRVPSAQPWRHARWLLRLRALGIYSRAEYGRWIRPRLRSVRETLAPSLVALLPGALVNAAFVCYFALQHDQGRWLQLMKKSPFYLGHTLKRAS